MLDLGVVPRTPNFDLVVEKTHNRPADVIKNLGIKLRDKVKEFVPSYKAICQRIKSEIPQKRKEISAKKRAIERSITSSTIKHNTRGVRGRGAR